MAPSGFEMRPAARRILAAAIHAVEPAAAVRSAVQRAGDRLEIGGEVYDLGRIRRVVCVGAGKAGAPMAAALGDILGQRLHGGLVIIKDGHRGEDISPPGVEILEAGHPLPDRRGVAGARRIAAALDGLTAGDLVIALISGGGSALMASPVDGVGLDDLQALTGLLLASGAGIEEINTLRKHLETLKGGGLARMAYPARLAALVLSDVVGDPLPVIASGPCVPDPTTYADAQAVLERYGLAESAPAAVRDHLKRGLGGEVAETPKPGDALFQRVQHVIVGNNRRAAEAAVQHARAEGFHSLLLTTALQGEARQAGRFLAAILREVAASGQPLERPACIVAGGETTVTLHGSGVGGRNQELALGAVTDLAGLERVALATLATDGGDGPTDAAGAWVNGETLQRALLAGMDPGDYLRRNDAYSFFDALGDLIRSGPTRTNVNDLSLLFAF